MPAIIGAIVTFFLRTIAVRVAFWLAVKGLLLFFGVFILPVIIYNFCMGLIEEYLTWMNSTLAGTPQEGLSLSLITLTGMGAWMAAALKIPECMSIIISAIKIRLFLMMIPGVK